MIAQTSHITYLTLQDSAISPPPLRTPSIHCPSKDHDLAQICHAGRQPVCPDASQDDSRAQACSDGECWVTLPVAEGMDQKQTWSQARNAAAALAPFLLLFPVFYPLFILTCQNSFEARVRRSRERGRKVARRRGDSEQKQGRQRMPEQSLFRVDLSKELACLFFFPPS